MIQIKIDMETNEIGAPSPPFVENARFRVRVGRCEDAETGQDVMDVAIDANRAGLKRMAYELLAMAHCPDELKESHLHFHITDWQYAYDNDSAAVAVYWDESVELDQ